MESSDSNSSSDDPRLQQVVAEALRQLDAGRRVDREALYAQHPDLADELRTFFANRDALERLARPLRATEEDPTLDFTSAPAGTNSVAPVAPRLPYFGDYELLEEIARGGMGVVYKARQVSLNRPVAVKMILAGQFASQGDIRRFRLEAEAAANLDHPHIVPIYEIGEHAGQQYFSMGFVEGQSLSQRLAEGPLAPREAAELIRTVAQAVEYAHEQGVVHRDLKPGNILLDKSGRPRVTDFGLAKRSSGDSNLTETGQVLGTPSYMPPEQAAGRMDAVGPAADVYALGAILYALLVGRPPFQAASSIDTLKQVLDREPVALRSLDASIPRDLETVTLKCLEKSLPRRYSTAAELVAELERFLAGRPVLARPVSRGERAWRWAKRNPVVSSLAASLMMLLVLAAIGSTIAAVAINRQRQRAVAAAKEENVQRKRADEQRDRADEQRARAEREEQRAVAQSDRARANLYLAYMNLAQKAWDDTALTRLRSLLTQTRPENMGGTELRGIEWHYWNRLLHRYQREFQAHQPGVIVSMAFSPDGKDLFTGAHTGKFRVSDSITGREIRTLKGFPSRAFRAPLDLSHDGKLLVTGSGHTNQTTGQAIVWDVARGEELYRLGDHKAEVNSVRFSPDGKWIAIGASDSTVSVWETASRTKKHAHAIPRAGTESLAISPDGRLLAAGLQLRVVHVWELESGKKLHESPDFLCWVMKVAFSPDSQHLAAGFEDGKVRSINAATGEVEFEQAGHKSRVQGLAYSPDGQRIVTCAQDDTLRVWSAADGTPLFHIKTGEPLTSCAFSVDGKQIVSGSQHGRVRFWDAGPVQEPTTLTKGSNQNRPPHWIGLEFSRTGKQLAVSSGEGHTTRGKFKLYSWPSGELQHTIAAQPWPVSKVHISPDGAWVVSIDTILSLRNKPCDAKVWDSRSGRLQFALPHPEMVFEAVFDPTGKQIATACQDGNLRLWDARDGKLLLLIEGQDAQVDDLGTGRAIEEVVFSHDGRLLASATRGAWIRVWDARTGKHLINLNNTAGGNVTRALAFNHAGTHLAGASSGRAIHIWDLTTGKVVRYLLGHGGDVNDVAYSPDDRRIISASTDGTVKIWDTDSGQEVLTLRGHADFVQAADIHPDGWQIASLGTDSTVKIWDFAPLPDEPKPPTATPPQIDPSKDSATIRSAIDDQRLNRLTADAESYRTLLETHNSTPFLRTGYGMVLLELEKPDEAFPHLKYGLSFPGTGGAQRAQLAQLLVAQPSLELFHRLLNEGSNYDSLVELSFHTAAHALLAGKPDTYQQVCRTMLDYHRRLGWKGRGVVELRTWSLTPPTADSEEEWMKLLQHVLKESGASLSTENPDDRQRVALHCAALVHWRFGNHEEAIRFSEAALRSPRFPELNHVVLAMAHQALGNSEKARSHLTQAVREPTNSAIEAHAHRILYREALRIIETSPPVPAR